ncbi:MAG TPA: phenylalanine--tRNA ligase subunit beta [Bacteroidia bacterium]|nr:phenylalanine--tRNA ligase subunit beta [Bacteroidia bacterium]
MKISYNWLKKYVATHLSPDEVAKLLTEAGLEVEHIEPFESFKGGLRGLVVGEVKTCIKHPNADKLSLTTVDVAGERLLNIVCGAPNVAAGQKVIVALEGALLYPSEGEPFTIKKSKIRGEASEGMICAEDEIGLGISHAGVMVLPPDTKIGLPAAEYFQIYTDSVFEIGVTPNRADALSHIGVARDLVAAINIHKKEHDKLELTPLVVYNPAGENNYEHRGAHVGFKLGITELEIRVQNPEACKRYTGAGINGIEVKESPQWLKNYISAIGLRPINNIVDITNFVMFETGQPLHAFDADKIKGSRVVVRKAKQGETIITLDGVERKLKEEDLLICNENEAMCIAGVYGGKESGVTEKTKNIFLESACFDAAHIRKTARHHGLHTDASFRFERGTDPNMTAFALMRAIYLLQEENPKITVSALQDDYPIPVEERKLEFSLSYANSLAGHTIPDEKMAEIIEATGIRIADKNLEKWLLSIPTYRMDITCQADIVEEILRFYGYNNIPIPAKLNIPLVHSGKKKPDEILYKMGDFLGSLGFSEVMNTSLSSSKFEESNETTVKIANPLSSDLDILRGSLLFNGLTNIALNQNNKQPDLKLYEFGRSYYKTKEGKYKETEHLSLWIAGNKTPLSWNSKEQAADFYNLKKYIDAIIEKIMGKGNLKNDLLENDAVFSYGSTINANSGELVKAGKVKESVLKNWGIKGDVYFADFNWKVLLQQIPKGMEVNEINRFPAVTRDLALIIDKQMPFSTLLELANKTERELLRDVSVFDVYEGKGVEEGKKSYALRFVLQSDSKTLSDKEIEKVMEKLTKAFTGNAGAVIRSS